MDLIIPGACQCSNNDDVTERRDILSLGFKWWNFTFTVWEFSYLLFLHWI